MALPDGESHVERLRLMIKNLEERTGSSTPLGPAECALYARWCRALLDDLEPLNESRQDR